ncbi:hypothetical protein LINPERPRIM_LOCUS14374 [Linum perenne]
MSRLDNLERAFPTHEGGSSDLAAARDDPRLRRLAVSRIDNRDEVRADHRRIRQAEIVSTEEEERQEGLDADEEDEEERRRRIKEKMRQEEEEEEEDEEEESEYETDSEEETTGMAMLKPVFVPKSERDTIAEREKLEEEERALEEKVKKKVEERKVETKHILLEEIKKEELIQKNLEMEASVADVDTDDERRRGGNGRGRTRNRVLHRRRSGGLCRSISTKVRSFRTSLMIKLRVPGLITSMGVTSLNQLGMIRWTRVYCLRLCKSSTLVVAGGRNGPILSMRILLTGTIRKHSLL